MSTVPEIIEYANPWYVYMKKYWEQLEIFHDNRVKDYTTAFLPKTGGQILDTKNGQERYDAYLKRTTYYNYIKQTVRDSKNTIVRKPATFKLPEKLEYLRENFNKDNESILAVLDDTFYEQIKLSRLGRLIDIVEEEDETRFKTVLYKALSIPSWLEKTEFVVNDEVFNLSNIRTYILLNETSSEITEKGTFEEVVKYRVLGLRYTGDDQIFRYYTIVLKAEEIEDLQYFVSPDAFDLDFVINKYGERYVEPNYGGIYLNYIPFTFINDSNLKATPDIPLLTDQMKLSENLYQKNANYAEIEQQQTYATLFGSGMDSDKLDNPIIVGAQSLHTNENARLGYVEISADGLTEVRLSQDNLKRDCQTFGGVEVSQKNSTESGKALETRVTLQTDKLRDISTNGVAGITQQLKICADWAGLEVSEVEGIANTDFRTERATTKDVEIMGKLWKEGKIPTVNYYNYQYENLYTNLTFEEWEKELKKQNEEIKKVENNDQTNVSEDQSVNDDEENE